MPVPDYQSFMLPLLRRLGEGAPWRFADLYEALAEESCLTKQDRAELIASGKPSYINRIAWARTYLKQAGLLEVPARSLSQITPRGRQALAENLSRIDTKYLERFAEFRAFKQRSRPSTVAPAPAASPLAETLEETLERVHRELNAALAADLLERIQAAPPAFFEQLVVDLMLAMGYGGSREDAGKALGRSGDGGIDGVIYEDRLGLDVVYLQAKRWDGSVGRPAVQGFVGSLVGNGASKGVLVTTSSFSREAQDFAGGLQQQKVILIDGQRLAALMIEYGLGVSVKETFVVKRLDEDYFDR